MTVTTARKKGASVKKPKTGSSLPISIHPIRDGEWLPREEFYAQVLGLTTKGVDIVVDLFGVEYLDASSLQMLLALNVSQKSKSHALSITRASPGLMCWFGYAGAVQEFIFA